MVIHKNKLVEITFWIIAIIASAFIYKYLPFILIFIFLFRTFRIDTVTTIIGLSFAIFFLVGLATTLTRSMMIGVLDVLPVYLLMGIAIIMMIYEAFFDKS